MWNIKILHRHIIPMYIYNYLHIKLHIHAHIHIYIYTSFFLIADIINTASQQNWGSPRCFAEVLWTHLQWTRRHGTTQTAMAGKSHGCMAKKLCGFSMFDWQKRLPSGKHTKSYWKWPLKVDFPIKRFSIVMLNYQRLPFKVSIELQW